ncbi:amino acid adenylation domain-containing protein [Thermosporothrix hazakensis]|uniref:Amino acid adenylation domain-containing protein n=2 Tax=Thermosporothrix hazakensis TaxID=644383 RepID=A0A326UAU9_THEHA|nr:amino acid adenylation domain-containing protein [Thermosporothrix hazakensis]
MSYGQQGLWVLYRLNPDSSVYNVHVTLRIRSCVDASVLKRALEELVRRHPVLRTTFTDSTAGPMQRVHASLPVPLTLHSSRNEAELLEMARAAILQPFVLECCPFRVLLLQRHKEDTLFLFVAHHIICDSLTMRLLLQELFLLYDTQALPGMSATGYRDFVRWQQEVIAGTRGEQLRAYWMRQLAGELSPPDLPCSRLPASGRAEQGATFVFTLDEELTQGIRALAFEECVTPYTVLLACFVVLLYRYTQQEDVLLGSPAVGRSRSEFEKVAGYFVNLLPLRIDVSGNPTFQQLLERVQQVVMDALEHQDYPFSLLVKELQPGRDAAQQPLLRTAFVWESTSLDREGFSPFFLGEAGVQRQIGSLLLESYAVLPPQEGLFDLSLMLYEQPTCLKGFLQYKVDLFSEDMVARMAAHFQNLVRGLIAHPERPLAESSLLGEDERYCLLEAWNQTQVPYPHTRCIHQLFAEQAQRAPEAVALLYQGEALRYGELDRRSNALALVLQARGVGPGITVGLFMERSPEFIIGMLAILKAGGVYVPLDPSFPARRLAFMCENARLSLVLTQEHLEPQVPPGSPPYMCVERYGPECAQVPENQNNPDDLAYIIYTSGSTGQPKGVEALHRGVVRLLFGVTYVQLDKHQRFLHHSSITFDAATFEIWGALLHGGCCVLLPERVLTPALLRSSIARYGVTITFFTSALFNLIVDEDPTAFRGMQQVVCGGEALSNVHVRRALEVLSPETRIINGYGPTETTTFACCHPIHPSEIDDIPIGRPIGNTYVYVLDRQLQPVPVGVPGELYIGGDGLARGYCGRPDLTAERFLPDPFRPGKRLYRTGDRVCWRADGTLSYLGRLDQQVKIRGYRIEPGEIEATLNSHPAVRLSVVLVREMASKGTALLAWVVPDASVERDQLPARLHSYLKERLPEYMIPTHLLLLDALPLLSSGKIDRHSLPLPALPAAQSACPRTPVEELVANIWREIMELEYVGREENFFALGGHSLLATRVVSRIERIFQCSFPLRDFFQAPTVAAVARRIEKACATESEKKRIISSERDDALVPLSFAQQRLWFLQQLAPDNPFYLIPLGWRLRGSLHVEVLERSLKALIERHESLRTCYISKHGQPFQKIRPVPDEPLLTFIDISSLTPAEQVERCREEGQREALTPFDLTGGLLLRARLLRLSGQEHILLLTVHHIACDGWSLAILQRELQQFYSAFVRGEAASLEPLPVRYRDFARWQREQEEAPGLLAYWTRQLADLPLLELPADFVRPQQERFRGAQVPLHLSPELVQKVKVLSQKHEVTLFMTLLAAFQVVLMRYCGLEDVAVGVPIANRTQFELEGLIGMFVNLLVIRTDLSGNPRVDELLRRVRQVTLDAYAHQDMPFERLVEVLCPQRSRERNPLCQVAFQLFNAPQEPLALPELLVEPLPTQESSAKIDVQVTCEEHEEGIVGSIEYNADLFLPEKMERLARHFEHMLEAFVSQTQLSLAEIPLLTEQEQQHMLIEWNRMQPTFPQDLCVHEVFEHQVACTPETLALVTDNETLCYRELDQRANQLAWLLRAQGIGPEKGVGVLMRRSLAAIVSFLAILKAGGVYVPLDPTNPPERLAFLLHDANISLLLAQEPIEEPTVPCIVLDHALTQLEGWSEQPPPNLSQPDNLAYVIYTSGSTGLPKGVEVIHRGLLNVARELKRLFQVQTGTRILQWASLSFDASLWDMMLSLLAGGTLYLPPPQMAMVGEELGRYLLERQIELISLTPSALRTLPLHTLVTVHTIIVGGEACPLELACTLSQGRRFRRFYNVYGPTEAAIWATVAECGPEQQKMHIGKPIAHVELYVLDRWLQPVPIGVPGELYIGGVGLARGYHNRPDLTAERFLPHPFSEEPGARVYRTGDLVRYLADGSLEFLGRVDHQVKVRGYRIELEEIEALLARHPAVQVAQVKLQDGQLFAYVVATGPAPSPDELAAYLRQRLPDYMVPATFILLDEFPLNAHGKIDRAALPESARLTASKRPPRTMTEKALAELWRRVLNIDEIGVHDDFFRLGGHSLLVAHLATEIQNRFNLLLPLALIMENSTVEALAQLIDQSRQKEEA